MRCYSRYDHLQIKRIGCLRCFSYRFADPLLLLTDLLFLLADDGVFVGGAAPIFRGDPVS
jgi:hypothetical protein